VFIEADDIIGFYIGEGKRFNIMTALPKFDIRGKSSKLD
jgi:hypothetical protein